MLNRPEIPGKSSLCTLSNSSSNILTIWWEIPRFSSRLAQVVLLTRLENLAHSRRMMKWSGTGIGEVRSSMLSTVLLKNWPVEGQPAYEATLLSR